MAKVLYVDHDVSRAMETRKLLGSVFDIDVAFNGWEGLGSALMYNPDAVILNLSTTIIEGLEVLRLIRTEEKLFHLPILCFSEPHNELFEQLAMERSCHTTLQYPFDRGHLIQLVNQAITVSQAKKAQLEAHPE